MKAYYCNTEEELEWFLKYADEKNYIWSNNVPKDSIKTLVLNSSICILVKESTKLMWLRKVSLADAIPVDSLIMLEKMKKFLETC